MISGQLQDEVAQRARDWRHQELCEACDVLEPWSHGLIARSSAHPDTYDFNALIAQRDPELDHDALIAVADEALCGLHHRRIDFTEARHGTAYRRGFEQRGWQTSCLVRMHHEGPSPDPTLEIQEVDYDEVSELRVRWHEEDFPGVDASLYFRTRRQLDLDRNVRVLGVRRGAMVVAFAQLEPHGAAAEVSDIYVTPDHRGAGIGTALTSAAVRAAAPAADIWITADAEDRPQHLYARLGFRAVHREIRFLRLPKATR